jgi:RHS repeat-associated protein
MSKRAVVWGIPAVAFVAATSAMILTGPSWAAMARRSLQVGSTGSVSCDPCQDRDSGKDGKKNAKPGGNTTQGAQTQGPNPVNVLSGEHIFSSVDFEVAGQNGMKSSRHYVTDPAYLDGDYGPGWRHGIPQLVRKGSNIVLVSASRGNVSWTDNGNGTYTPTFYFKDTLSAVSDHSLRYKDEDGNGIAFYDFSSNWDPRLQGRVAYTSNAFLTNVYTGTEDSFLYYNGNSTTPFRLAQRDQVPVIAGTGDFNNENKIGRALTTNFGQIQVTTNTWNQFIGGTGKVWRQVSYSYYDGSTGNGPAGALQFVHIRDQNGNPVETKYYRYGALNGAGQLPLTFVVEGAAYERLLQASPGKTDLSVDQQSNSFISTYANAYLYDSSFRVTSETVQGKGTTTYDPPVLSGFANDLNTWNTMDVEHRPDGNTVTRYVSYSAQPLLTDLQSGSQHFITYYQYDTEGRLISEATPSAVASYTTVNPPANLGVVLNASTGLIKLTTYATSTTATATTAGDVQGYIKNKSVKKGSSGTAVLVESFTYKSHTATEQVAATTYPLASRTVYRNTDGSGGQTTTYGFTWQIPPGDTTESNQVGSITTTYPTVTPAQNGPPSGTGAATTTIQFFDQYRRPTWKKDENGFIHYQQWDNVTGGLQIQIVDVDTTKTGDFSNLPTGWTTPAGGGLHLKTLYGNIDGFGRATMITNPNTFVTYKIYNDTAWEVRTYPGTTGSVTTGPTQVQRQDKISSYRESLTMFVTPHLTNGIPDGTEGIASVVNDTREYLDTGNRVVTRDSYVTPYWYLPAWNPTTSWGVLGTDFYRETFGYDLKGRQIHRVDWTGTIRDTVYDGRDQVTATKIGTNDTSPSNMIQDYGYEYDSNGIGNGNLTKIRQFTSASTSLDTIFTYDYRDRKTQVQTPDGVNVVYTLDNLGEITLTQTYGGSVTGANLRSQLLTAFDEKGQIYQKVDYQVDCETDASPGMVRDGRTTNFWSNARGLEMKKKGPNGEFTKRSYDGARRVTALFTSFDDAEANTDYASASTVTGDFVVQQINTTYDADGNVILTTTYRHCPSSTKTGDLSSGWLVADSRRMYFAEWFDAADRTMGTADYGTNGGATLTRPSNPPSFPTGDTISYILTEKVWDIGGRLTSTNDNKDRTMLLQMDGLNRVIQSVENTLQGGLTETQLDTNRTINYTYDSSGRLFQQTALNPKGSGKGIESQTTTYIYGTTANSSTPAVYRNDVLVAEIYPDSDDTFNPLANGADGVYDRVEYTYDYASRKSTMKDQRGVVRTFTYDSAGRFSADSVTTLPSGVDGSVRRIGRTYDSVSRKQTTTSYSDAAGSTVANQVKYTYGNLERATKREDSHVGAVVPGTTPSVQVAYSDGGPGSSGGAGKYVRPVSTTYPNARQVFFNYPAAGATSVGDHLSRIDNIAQDSAGATQFAQYGYMGAATILDVAHPQVTNGLIYRQGPENNPGGWDQFDRQIMTKWRNSAVTYTHAEWDYTYDSVSNVLTKKNNAKVTSTVNDEFYVYDGLRRLTEMNRGALSGSPLTITDANRKFGQNWNALESAGNWRSFRVAPTGGTTYSFVQTRTHNRANEIDNNNADADAPAGSITVTGGNAWILPTADKAGNATTTPVPGNETLGYFHTYDAWNRLVKVQNGTRSAPGSEVVEFQYDAENRRTVKLVPNGSNWNRTDYYFNLKWQCVEERTATGVSGKTTVATVPSFQWVWDLKHIDAVLFRDVVPIDTAKRLYYCQDANQNTTALVNQAGTVVERYAYDPYGKVAVLDINWVSQAANVNNNEILFAGYRKDPETQLYLARNRVYHSTLGRWMQRDPIRYADSLNLYEYVRSSPNNRLDPYGLQETGGLPTSLSSGAGGTGGDVGTFLDNELKSLSESLPPPVPTPTAPPVGSFPKPSTGKPDDSGGGDGSSGGLTGPPGKPPAGSGGGLGGVIEFGKGLFGPGIPIPGCPGVCIGLNFPSFDKKKNKILERTMGGGGPDK